MHLRLVLLATFIAAFAAGCTGDGRSSLAPAPGDDPASYIASFPVGIPAMQLIDEAGPYDERRVANGKVAYVYNVGSGSYLYTIEDYKVAAVDYR